MSNVLFTSDLHLGHKLMLKKRGFSTIEEHDNYVIDSISSFCKKDTLLWVLGDVSFKIENLELLNRIPGRKRLVMGNHDKFNSQVYLKYFERADGLIKKYGWFLSHCPIHPQELHRCSLNVHGHIHREGPTSTIGYPYLCVNWDFFRMPVSLDSVRKFEGFYKDFHKEDDNDE